MKLSKMEWKRQNLFLGLPLLEKISLLLHWVMNFQKIHYSGNVQNLSCSQSAMEWAMTPFQPVSSEATWGHTPLVYIFF